MGTTGLPVNLWLRVERTLKHLFDENIYERANFAMSLGLHKVLRNWVLSSVQGKVLDVGCGDGVYIPALSEKVEEVVCVDPVVPRRLFSQANIHRVVALAEYLPFRARSFDSAIAMFSFRDFLSKARGVFNMAYVSRNGVLVLELFSVCEALRPFTIFYFGYIAPLMGFIVSGGRRGGWRLLVPTLLLMPRAGFFSRIGGRVLVRKALGLVSIVYVPPLALHSLK